MKRLIEKFKNFRLERERKNTLTLDYFNGIMIIFLSFFFIFNFGFFFHILSWDTGFLDSASPFMESLIDLYFTVWYVLIVVVVIVIYVLVRLMYSFLWNSLNINFYKYFKNSYFIFFFDEENRFNGKIILTKFIYLYSKIKSKTSIITLWYIFNKEFFLMQNIIEYKNLELWWCASPTFSLMSLGSPTFGLIFALDPAIDPYLCLKVIGHQWYWSYEYDVTVLVDAKSPDYIYTERFKYMNAYKLQMLREIENSFLNAYSYSNEELLEYKHEENGISFEDFLDGISSTSVTLQYKYHFDSNMIDSNDLPEGSKRLLTVSKNVVLPIGVPIKVLITSTDVLHSWAIPNLGIKVDAVPGRLNQFIFEIKHLGFFYGQCSELCGPLHGFMPIVIQAVSVEEFENWIKKYGEITNKH